jgi:hypothetical protein
MLFSHEGVYSLPSQSSPISFLRVVTRENMAYIVNRAYKKAPNLAANLSRLD